jgi:hypothetical protein
MSSTPAAPLDEQHPVYGPFFGVMGAAAAIVFSGKLKFFHSTERAKKENG